MIRLPAHQKTTCVVRLSRRLALAFAFAVMFAAAPAVVSAQGDFGGGFPDNGFAIPEQTRVAEANPLTVAMPTVESLTAAPSESGGAFAQTSSASGTVTTTTTETTVPTAGRLTDLLRRGGLLMIPIGICSFILVVFVFERFISLRKGRIIPGHFTKRFLEQLRDGQLTQNAALAICDKNNSAMADVFRAGVAKWGKPAVEVEQAVLDEGERTSNRLRKYLRLINGVATVCPLLGLLGTVFGMIHAFDSIASTSGSGVDQASLTATGISQALITTAAGLSVAIPALIAYLFFSSRADKHVMEIDQLGMKVVNQISAEGLAAKKTKGRSTRKAA